MATFLLFDVSGGEIFIILLFIIIFFGSKRIPELARGLGKGIREFKDAANSIQREITDSAGGITNPIQEVVKPITEPIDQTMNELKNDLQAPVLPNAPEATIPYKPKPLDQPEDETPPAPPQQPTP